MHTLFAGSVGSPREVARKDLRVIPSDLSWAIMEQSTLFGVCATGIGPDSSGWCRSRHPRTSRRRSTRPMSPGVS